MPMGAAELLPQKRGLILRVESTILDTCPTWTLPGAGASYQHGVRNARTTRSGAITTAQPMVAG